MSILITMSNGDSFVESNLLKHYIIIIIIIIKIIIIVNYNE